MKATFKTIPIALLLFWGCGIPFNRYNSQPIVKIDDRFSLRNNGYGDTVLTYAKHSWGPPYDSDTMWIAVLKKPQNIISYPNQFLLAKDSLGYLVVGFKDSYAEYWEHYKDKQKFIDYANKIGAPLAGTENW
jgi:hypothetical protein